MAKMTDTPQAEALLWLSENASLLGAAYSVYASWGEISVQGEAGSLQGLVRWFAAQPDTDRGGDFVRWTFKTGDGVLIHLIEDRGGRSVGPTVAPVE